IRNVVWVTADVHYAAAIHYEPGRARFTNFTPFWEFVAGPIHAGTFGPNEVDRTFGPEVKYQSVPDGMKQNRPPPAGRQYFGGPPPPGGPTVLGGGGDRGGVRGHAGHAPRPGWHRAVQDRAPSGAGLTPGHTGGWAPECTAYSKTLDARRSLPSRKRGRA